MNAALGSYLIVKQPLARPKRVVSESGMKIGYARVSTEDRSLGLQHDALERAGFDCGFEDDASGTTTRRLGLDVALARLSTVDAHFIWKLDRLERSLPHLFGLFQKLGERNVKFQLISVHINSAKAATTLNVGRSTLYRAFRADGGQL